MVMMRSSAGMYCDRTLSMVVLPEPVPPEMTALIRETTQALRNSTASAVIVPYSISWSMVIGLRANFRIVRTGPTSEIGGMTALTREPSGRRGTAHGAGFVAWGGAGRERGGG